MIGLDTNVLVRYFVRDDARQTAVATALIETLSHSRPAFVSHVALIELVWVLDRSYGVARDQIAMIVERVLQAGEVVVENSASVHLALAAFRAGADFADALIVAVDDQAGCAETVTFDTTAAKRAGMRLLR